MKKINIFIIMIAAIMMMSCEPNDRQKRESARVFVNQSSFFKVDYVLTNSYNISHNYVCYIIASDKYEAQRLFDKIQFENTIASVKIEEFMFDKIQPYPYK